MCTLISCTSNSDSQLLKVNDRLHRQLCAPDAQIGTPETSPSGPSSRRSTSYSGPEEPYQVWLPMWARMRDEKVGTRPKPVIHRPSAMHALDHSPLDNLSVDVLPGRRRFRRLGPPCMASGSCLKLPSLSLTKRGVFNRACEQQRRSGGQQGAKRGNRWSKCERLTESTCGD